MRAGWCWPGVGLPGEGVSGVPPPASSLLSSCLAATSPSVQQEECR